jgi:glycosyltransferase involved in cell wall biosynthesis
VKITHLSHSDSKGGAANFVSRVIEAVDHVGVENELIASNVNVKTDNVHVLSKSGNKSLNFLKAKTSQTLDSKLRLLERTNHKTYKSPNLIGALCAKNLDKLDNDVFNLHWINGGLISIRQIGKLNKPIVWTMLDMWPFLGSEHYLMETDPIRFINGYNKHNRAPGDQGLDICKISWNLKLKYFNEINLISPSRWLANQASSSVIFRDHRIEIIPPPIDTLKYLPVNKKTAQLKFKVSEQSFVIGFLGGTADRKGWKFVKELCESRDLNPKWKFLLGGSAIANYSNYKEITGTAILAGNIKMISDLVSFYSSIDVLLVPSIAEAYGLVAQEAQACGVPVIVFSDTGAEDTVIDGMTGFIVKDRSAKGLSLAIQRLSSMADEQRNKMSITSRNRAEQEWNYKIIGDKYFNFYNFAIDKKLSER